MSAFLLHSLAEVILGLFWGMVGAVEHIMHVSSLPSLGAVFISQVSYVFVSWSKSEG